jgi:hypothetical protein
MKKQKPPDTEPFVPTAKKLGKLLRKTKTIVFGSCMGEIARYVVQASGDVVEKFSITLELLMTNQGTDVQPSWQSVSGTENFSLSDLRAQDFSDWTLRPSDGTVTAKLTTGEGKKKKVVTYTFVNERHRLAKPKKPKKHSGK